MALVFTTDDETDDESGWAEYQGEFQRQRGDGQSGEPRIRLGPKEGLALIMEPLRQRSQLAVIDAETTWMWRTMAMSLEAVMGL
jgi:hypothetical protein